MTDVPSTTSARLITRPFVVVTVATFLFFLYVGVQIPLIPRLIEDGLGGSELDIGLNLAAFSIAAILIRPVLGQWGDRYGRRWLMIAGSIVAAVAVVAMTLVEDRWALLPLRGIAGIGEAGLFVGAATMISDLAPPHRRAEAASYFSVAVFGGIGVGPIIGEALIGNDHFDRGLLATAGFGFAAAAVSAAVPRNVMITPDDPAGPAADDRRHLFHRAALRPGAVLALAMAGFATFNAFMPDHTRAVGLDGSKWVFATYSVVCLVVRIAGARLPERIGLNRAVGAALVFLSLGLATVAAIGEPVGVYGGTVLVGLGMAFLYPALMATAVNSVSESGRARVISTFTMFFEVGTAAGGIVFGTVAEITSKRGGFLAGAGAAALALWVLWRVLIPSLRTTSRSSGEQVAEAPGRRLGAFTNLS
jgi:MFS family permease